MLFERLTRTLSLFEQEEGGRGTCCSCLFEEPPNREGTVGGVGIVKDYMLERPAGSWFLNDRRGTLSLFEQGEGIRGSCCACLFEDPPRL